MNITRTTRRGIVAATALATSAVLLTACAGGGSDSSAGDGTGEIDIWALQGQDSENAALQAAVDGFNSSQSDITASLRLIAGDTYTTTITSTPKDQLPDVLQIDGPTLASFAYNGKITPISEYVSPETIDNATAGSISEGTSGGELYALAQFDSAMGLYGNKALLDAAGVTYPTSIDTAWTSDEFTDALATLAAASPSGKALDLNEAGLAGEWGTYAFAPFVWSAGGNLLQDDTAAGALDSEASVEALTDIAAWKPFVDSNADGNAFPHGRVALGVGGHWNYPAYSEALGDDLLVMPLPDFGNGPKAGAGSLTWGIGAGTDNGSAAGAFLDYLLNDDNVTAMTQANGAPPATASAFAADPLYKEGGPLALFGEQLANSCASDAITDGCVAVYRPITAGYPTVTSQFASALSSVWGGSAPLKTLQDAATTIDQNFADNDGYQQ
ncbi:extracellular solute-binding protein [Microbacterium sp. VKM Ac-2923]|uniref:sugar ABC transporter substrate-binding protein n=1 Tax=Microbacterium sp. VKM Ac-2923 TaxID=2929476 RepID=UPI001FB35C65|nr:extracellular solute-binding protein [Microbacterium sp. VKM Ac-2923]MCJ1706097.1 extracellular solute-binding protein [Microbacterium sp. VKM Ac-2923]